MIQRAVRNPFPFSHFMTRITLLRLGGLFLSLATLTQVAQAQWQTTTYSLKGGWNSIYLSGDANHDALENLFPSQVEEVWRWNPNPAQVQFTSNPLIPASGTPEWSVWKRSLPNESTLNQLSGQTAYLVKCTGTTSNNYSVSLKQATLLPTTQWVRSGANLMGFPTLKNGSNYPLFSNFFSTFPAAIASNTRVYKYVGGDLSATNPLQLFSMTTERVDRTQAYWFSADVVNNFYGPLEISSSTSSGLAFGRTGSIITLTLRNRSSTATTVTLSPLPSESSPASRTAIVGTVPLTRRSFNTTTLVWDETPVTGSFTQLIGPQTSVELSFGINRGDSSMTAAAAGDAFASFLRLTDSGNLMEVNLPVSAQKASLSGLWVGDISVNAAGFTATGAGATAKPFPLRTLLHVDDQGTARLLSQIYIGRLSAPPYDVGLTTRESGLKQDEKASAQRLVAAHLPLDQVITAGSGSVALGQSLVCAINVPYADATNPFVHQHHPDHDNKNARFQPVGNKVESYTIDRSCTFNFTTTPPPGSSVQSGWGSTVIGGTYTETLTGIHKNSLRVTGTFELRRASEQGEIDVQP
jgi:hypothetical protein